MTEYKDLISWNDWKLPEHSPYSVLILLLNKQVTAQMQTLEKQCPDFNQSMKNWEIKKQSICHDARKMYIHSSGTEITGPKEKELQQ